MYSIQSIIKNELNIEIIIVFLLIETVFQIIYKFEAEVPQNKHLGLRVKNDTQKSVFNAVNESSVLQNLIELKYYKKVLKTGNIYWIHRITYL